MTSVSPIPVVLLHGALRSSLGMAPTVRGLRRRGLDARGFDYRTRRETLAEHAERLEQEIRAWLGDRRPPTLGLLTHSMGGLVARALLDRPTLREIAPRQRLVMLAPPNQGAVLAARHRELKAFQLLYGRAAEELQPERIAALALPPASCTTLILVGGTGDGRGYNPLIPGDDDGVVGLDESRLPGIEPVFVGGVHSTLQWRADVLERAAAFLTAVEDAGESGEGPASAEGQT